MLFNKGLALGGAMLVVAIPGQSATLHAQSIQEDVAIGRTVTVRTGAARSTLPASASQTASNADAKGLVIAASNAPTRVPAPTPVASEPVSVVDAAIETVTKAVQTVVTTVVAAADTVVDTFTAVIAPTTTVSTERSALLLPEPILASQPAPATDPTVTDPSPSESFATPTVAKTFTVSNLTELRSALAAAQQLAGAEIRVNPGNYGDLVWNFKKYTLGRVYVVAATSTKPVFRSIQANSSNNISFHGLKVAGMQTGAAVQMNSSQNMSFTGGEIAGVTQDLIPRDEGAVGIQVRFSTNVVVQDVRFSDLRSAMYVQRSKQVWIRYNRMQYIREGLNVIATDSVQMRGNHFTHFFPRFDTGEHPDAMQLWTTGETVGSTRVRISENLISMGGPRAIQGLLSGCEAAGVRHADWEVWRNVYYGSSVHGLSFQCVDGLKTWNNVIVASPHADLNKSRTSLSDPNESGGYLPRLRIRASTNVSAWNNVLMAGISLDTTPIERWDNWDIVDAMGWGGVPWTDIFAGGRPTAEAPPLTAFLTRNPSAAFTRNGGVTTPFVHGTRGLTKNAELSEVLGLLGA
jgi:hypothetical protein